MFNHVSESYKRHYLIQARQRKLKGETHNENWKVNSLTATRMRKMKKESREHPDWQKEIYTRVGVF